MPEIPEILGTITEIVVTMAGFMGVIVAFNRNEHWGKEVFYRIQWTFSLSLVVVVALLSPHFLIGFSDEPSVVFGIPLVFFGLALVFLLYLGLWQQRTGKTGRTGSGVSRALLVLATIGLLIALLLSGFDTLIPRRPEMLVLGSIWSICLIAFGFISSIWQGVLSDDA